MNDDERMSVGVLHTYIYWYRQQIVRQSSTKRNNQFPNKRLDES